ncbi:MAG: response regulator, partial [Candidatus Omnitrophica bacterium]|nr:response regulator [Candidatus Omnitrophota bacterium]
MLDKPLTTFEIAEYCKISHRTVQQWITTGKLKSFRTPGNHNRVEVKNFIEFLNEYKMPIPEELAYHLRTKKRILVIDDDPAMVLLIKEYLQEINNVDITEAYDGFSAGTKFAEFKPDLITLDINMPDINGYEVLRHIRFNSIKKNVKTIVITGECNASNQEQLQKLGVETIFLKPFSKIELLEKTKE